MPSGVWISIIIITDKNIDSLLLHVDYIWLATAINNVTYMGARLDFIYIIIAIPWRASALPCNQGNKESVVCLMSW
jgi:hypothetical protein